MKESLFWRQRKIREHFESVQVQLGEFLESAEQQLDINDKFVDNETYTGELADSAKEYVKEVESALIKQQITAVEQLTLEQERILQEFSDEVDDSQDAVLYTDSLEKITRDFQDLKATFLEIPPVIDEITQKLMTVSEYGPFTKPNPSPVRTGFRELIGGEYYGSTLEEGIVPGTLNKFRAFDAAHCKDIEKSSFMTELESEIDRRRTLESTMS